MNITEVGQGKVVLLAGGGKVFTDIAARFVGSNRSLEDIVGSEYNKNIVKRILESGHLAATEFDYFVFGVEGYSRVTETQLVRKRHAAYCIKSGRSEKGGKREFDIVLPKNIKESNMVVTKTIEDINTGERHNIDITVNDLLSLIETFYNKGIKEGLPEEDLRYLKPQATEFKGLIGMNCYSDDTEILTDRGWVLFKDLTELDKVYSLNPDNMTIELIKPVSYIKKRYVGDMIHVKTKSIDLLTTPEHNNLVSYNTHKKKKERVFILDNAINMLDKKHVSMTKVGKPISGKIKKNFEIIYDGEKQTFEINKFMRLLGFYIGDGCCIERKDKPNVMGINLVKGDYEKLVYYKNLIFELTGVEPKIYENNTCYTLVCYNKYFYKYFKKLGKAYHKHIPQEIFGYDSSILQHLYYGLEDADANVRFKNGIKQTTFSTSSKQLSDDITRLLLHLGISGTVKIYDRRGHKVKGFTKKNIPYEIETKSLEYRISVSFKNNKPFIKDYQYDKIIKETYDGYVYCVELEKYHTLFVRRNGKSVWSGNCHALIDFFNVRCCERAQAEIRDMAWKMLKLCKKASPDLFKNAGPKCFNMLYCPENEFMPEVCKRKGIPTKNETIEMLLKNDKTVIYNAGDRVKKTDVVSGGLGDTMSFEGIGE